MNSLNEQVSRMKSLMGLITEGVQDKVAVLLDGTSSAGKTYPLENILDPKPKDYYEASNHNEWVIIASDHFSGVGEGEQRRLKLDHPNIRDWAEGNEYGIASGLVRRDNEDIPDNPYEDEYIEGTDSRVWYMAQEFKTGPWKKVIFDDIGKDIKKYLPTVTFKHLLVHAPIYILLGNVSERNDKAKGEYRNPTDVLNQYIKKYEATTTRPDETIGDPFTVLTKDSLRELLSQSIDDETYIDGFISDLGIVEDGNYYIKVRGSYMSDDIELVNVDKERMVYIDKIVSKL